ncbi:MAG: helix-turn-helix transcriptional regulator [Desulfobacteraceae bacterium]|nr:helix-turn-helix transcriptional regulator [Desulfobacteraceae bacterium]
MEQQINELSDKLVRKFFLGFINLHILFHAKKEPIYGKEFKKELERHGYDISFGTLYPIFHNLKKDGYLKIEEKTIKGKIRKYYTITEKGKDVLDYSIERARELFDELFE